MNDSGSKDEQLTLELLDAIEERSDVSQRHLAAKLGIALGLTNSYLKRCAKKGYVKVKEVPANRYLYYLTPKGFTEKSRLTARFLSTSLRFYRQAAEACSELFDECQRNRWRRIVLCGTSDLAEIAYTRSGISHVQVIGFFDPHFNGDELLSTPVWKQWGDVEPADAYIVTDLDDPLNMYRILMEWVPDKDRILVPRVLGLENAIKKGS